MLFLAASLVTATVDKGTFEKTISDPELVLVAFTMPGCQQCEEFLPDFAEICQNRKCIQVDDINLGTKFQVEGFPTVGIFQNSYFKKFAPEKSPILDFLKELDVLQTVVPSAWKKSKTAFAISANAEPTLAHEFRVARKFLALPGQVEYVEISEISDPQEISIFREGVVEFTMKWTSESAPMFRRILAGERVALFAEVDRENYELYEYLSIDRSPDFPGRGLVWVCFEANRLDEQRENNRAMLEKFARHFRRHFSFVWIDTKTYGEQAERQIGCKMHETMPALVVHIPGERPANLRRHQFNGADGIFDELALGIFLDNVLADKAEYFFRSKPDNELLKDEAVPEISSRLLETAVLDSEKTLVVGVTVKERELCDEACDKFISDLAVLRALIETDGIAVCRLDGIENDPPRPFVFWDNVPYLFIIKNGTQTRFNAQDNNFSLEVLFPWINEHLGLQLNSTIIQGDEARRKFVSAISDSTLKAEVHKTLLRKDDDMEISNEDWDDLDDEL